MLCVCLHSVKLFVFAFFLVCALFMNQPVRKNLFITLKLGPTKTIHSLKIILLQCFQQ